MQDYNKYTIKTVPFNADELSELIWALEIDSVVENDDSLFIYIKPGSEENVETIKAFLQTLVENSTIEAFELEEEFVVDRNWNEEYEKNVQVVKVTDKIVIKPTFKEYVANENELIIHIDPKMSFGTGEHETTKLVLTLLQKYVKGNEFVLDVGSGTAILAITAIKLGAAKAIAVDNDEWCKLNGDENIALNSLEKQVTTVLGELKDVKENNFNLVLANINKHILMDIKDNLKEKLNINGTLILSGLLDVDEKDILVKYNEFHLIEKIQMNEWIALVFKL